MPKSTQVCYWNQPALNNEGIVIVKYDLDHE